MIRPETFSEVGMVELMGYIAGKSTGFALVVHYMLSATGNG